MTYSAPQWANIYTRPCSLSKQLFVGINHVVHHMYYSKDKSGGTSSAQLLTRPKLTGNHHVLSTCV